MSTRLPDGLTFRVQAGGRSPICIEPTNMSAVKPHIPEMVKLP
jgi:hypothetical protein